MRRFFEVLAFTLANCAVFAADVRDLGVPAGWRASDYDRHGYELLNKGDDKNARRYFDAAIRSDPYMWTAYYNRAMVSCQQRNWAAALQDLNSAIRLKPSFLDASLVRSHVHMYLGDYKAGLNELSRLVELTWRLQSGGQYSFVLNSRAWLYATCPDASIRNGQFAIADARKACELGKWKYPGYIDTLAAAYAEAGDFDSAVRYEERAITVNQTAAEETARELATGMSKKIEKRLADVMKNAAKGRPKAFAERLELYKQHRPYRENPVSVVPDSLVPKGR